ncbi:hypothetical protein IA01_00030 [Flavobacterium psychrophilum]|uniref:Gliding motility protein RemF n=2 Tax=Flavobacterium psychrophilum TaxID=96345 RepID=A6GVK9_FLAPJ|nr:hypothetical protein [Flavobacterium psychrophilum]AIG31233.1 hypothetical protein IA03_12480 [Flavobacterium psychrophilum]AIG31240.1 hypothetical protein IA01_00030 [Flavobacterium psychrophilum]AIG35661.1 hypothetical protein IA02_11890 [Flavobacterium psychrophilum]AIG38021.1 hypothetical protein IA04_12365 [Flavobacterium psychrophilum]AIG40293.1 hypothetical protein IA05_12490 [Flavobacterium psychrophilum]
MKKIVLFSLFILFTVSDANAQKTNKPVGIISSGASLKKFYEKTELDGMNKGLLLELYIERIKVLVNTLPYIALTTKPGVTMQDVGVPASSENDKTLSLQKQNTETFLNSTVDFQRAMTPYADKGNLVSSILYYEAMLKALEQINE